MKEVVNRRSSAKEDGIQDKAHGEDHDDRLFRERDVMSPQQVELVLNVFELLYGVHGLPLTQGCFQVKKSRFHV